MSENPKPNQAEPDTLADAISKKALEEVADQQGIICGEARRDLVAFSNAFQQRDYDTACYLVQKALEGIRLLESAAIYRRDKK